jgi:hypothetical protein
MAAKSSLGLIALLFLSGSLVMLWFIILSGLTPNPPLNNTYFLQADTSEITGARPVSRWTYFFICGDGNTDCSGAKPAPAFGSAWVSEPKNAPEELVGGFGDATTSFYYWYMWRFGWVFFLITLFFEVVAFFAGFIACCGRLGSAIAGFVAMVALFFSTISVSLMTATFVKARNAFLNDGRDAHVGTYAFGFAWGSWAALLIASILFCMGTRGDRAGKTGGRRWGRSRSTRSRRSYDIGSRRVKDEYA